MSDKTASEMIETKTVCHKWLLKNWNKCHSLLASTSSCIVEIDDMKLRFSLRPHEQSVMVSNEPHTNKWYALWVEQVGGPSKTCLIVSTTTLFDTSCGNLGPVPIQDGEYQVTIDQTKGNGRDGNVVVDAHFILLDGWTTVADEKSLRRRQFQDLKGPCAYSRDAINLGIKFEVSKFVLAEISNDSSLNNEKGMSVNIDVEKLSTRYSSLLGNGNASCLHDVEIKCKDGIVLEGHRAILASGSPVFHSMFLSEMIESRTGKVEVPDLSSKVIKLLMEYIYTGAMDQASLSECIEEVVYGAAKYQLSGLLKYCDLHLISFCTFKNAMALLRTAKLHWLSTAEGVLREFVEKNSAKIVMEMV